MRPLRLDIAGFAAFRDPISVDFTDSDYFALTGPTGSGKSTVIDAMTFALYGSAPRWGRENAIQYALAPTANRCAVRLVFDVAGARYAVAREVRRSGKTVGQRNPRLERYLDPEATGDLAADEPVESLAADAKAVRQQVVELLGLDFDDFCTCVVLPQGDFATFLKASVAERQTILLKLLGARHYEAIARMANRRAADANARIDALQGQLDGYADATAETEAAARRREVALVELAAQVRVDVDAISDVAQSRSDTAGRAAQLTEALTILDLVEAPADIAALQRSSASADTAYETAARAERAADDALSEAEQALAAGPQRAPLEETLRWHADHALLAARLPAAEQADREAAAELVLAQQAAESAGAELGRARADHDHRRGAVQQCSHRLAAVEQRLDTLRSVHLPDGIEDLDQAAREAQAGVDRTTAALEAAETAVSDNMAAVAALPERSAIASIQRTVSDYTSTADLIETSRQQLAGLTHEASAALEAAALAAHDLAAARSALERLTTTSAAAGLRPQLQVGEACPVCDQAVAMLPPPLHEPELDAARAAVITAEEQERSARTTESRLQARLTGLTSQRDAQAARLTELDQRLQQELPDRPSGVGRDAVADHRAIEALLSRLDDAQAARQSALRMRETARAERLAADEEIARVAEQTRHGWELLHTTRGHLATLGAPAVAGTGLAASWVTLVDWCRQQADETAAAVTSAQDAATTADDELAAAVERLSIATGAAQATVERRQAAAVAASTAQTEHTDLRRRLSQLATSLTERPTEPEARDLLTEHLRLDAAARDARARAQTTGQARQQAEAERGRWRVARERARAALHRAREPFIALGVPVLDDADLEATWAVLVDWATAEATVRRTRLDGLGVELAAADDDISARLVDLDLLLAAHEQPVTSLTGADVLTPGGRARLQRIATDVEIAVERARAATATVARRREEAGQVRSKISAETDTEQVARQLGQMMSAKRFPQWLADAALDTLVADASASLLELSGGQFELTHEKGEFFVVDHADADSLRSVKTLSGGETFQASLALALALSEQLSTLAAGGRTTLDSIFLDEGFGTLDPDALETVASTLENLAQGRRMVGVVTHVAALAERVPVRFEVSRDSRTSMIERVGS